MKKNILDDLYICDLYQVDKEIGYLPKNELSNKLFFSNYKGINIIDTIIVKKNKFILSKYRLKEIITGLPIDTVYDYKNSFLLILGNKKEYDTFVFVPFNKKNVTLDYFNDYCDKHPDAEEYRNQLIELLNQGKINHDKMKHVNYLEKLEEEKAVLERINRINSHVKAKSYKRVKNMNNR